MPEGGKTVNVKGDHTSAKPTENKAFTFDHCYYVDSKQETVFEDLGKPIVHQALDGYNGTLFAYGQTGSGKTFSMMGVSGDEENKGVIPRLNEQLFKEIDDMKEAARKGSLVETETEFMVTVSELYLTATWSICSKHAQL